MSIFNLEYEIQIKKLKHEFLSCEQFELYCTANQIDPAVAKSRLKALQVGYKSNIKELRDFIVHNLQAFNIANVSSVFGIPSQTLCDDERLIHRIWLGGALPELTKQAITQWVHALQVTANSSGCRYIQMLWVWDVQQLAHDPQFVPHPQGNLIGSYQMGEQALQVGALASLLEQCALPQRTLLHTLHAKAYYVNLSDYFRILILKEFGGIYLDADTMPYRSAALFLAKPEVPDYLKLLPKHNSNALQPCYISWLNLYGDENGVLIAKRENPAVQEILIGMNGKLNQLGELVPDKCRHALQARSFASDLHDATYGVWQQEMGRSFQSLDELTRNHAVLHDGRTETMVLGLQGMRLQVDAITQQPCPLTTQEVQQYQQCVRELDRCDWRLNDALQLEELAEVAYVQETPRMAYPPQLRAQIDNCHYYSFLSQDEKLDRVNELFAQYLLAKNSQRIQAGNYWSELQGSGPRLDYFSCTPTHTGSAVTPVPTWPHWAQPGLRWKSGRMLSEACKDRMAQLLFATSYLEYCSFSNKLNLPFVALQRHQNIDPYLEHSQGMFDADEQFLGFFTAAPLDELRRVTAPSYYRDEMQAMDQAYAEFVQRLTKPHDYFVASLAIEEKYRGQGLFKPLCAELERRARQRGCTRLTLTAWEHSSALQIYLKKGFKVRASFSFAYNIFFDHLHFLEYPLTSSPTLTFNAQVARPHHQSAPNT